MASKTDRLLTVFEQAMQERWPTTLSGAERTWFLVFDPAELRRIILRLGDFEGAARRVGRRWTSVSMAGCFPTWMADHDYREAYFEDPTALNDQLTLDFLPEIVRWLDAQLANLKTDDNTLIALLDVAALFGFARLSEVLAAVSPAFRGRLVVFFPGEYQQNQYRLLDVGDGWNYLARPLTI